MVEPVTPRDRLVGTLAPAVVVGEVDGVRIVVVMIELWRRRTVVHLVAEPDEDAAAALDAAHAQAMADWEAAGYHPRDGMPEHPVDAATRGLDLRVWDSTHGDHRRTWSITGGSDANGRATYAFEAGVPPTATSVALSLGERSGTVTVDLPRHVMHRRLRAHRPSPEAAHYRAQRTLTKMGVHMAGHTATGFVLRLLAELDEAASGTPDDELIARAAADVGDGALGLAHDEPHLAFIPLDAPAGTVLEAAERALILFGREVLARHRADPVPLEVPPPLTPAQQAERLQLVLDEALRGAASPFDDERTDAAFRLRGLQAAKPLAHRLPEIEAALQFLRDDADPDVASAARDGRRLSPEG
ncbi:hypothetical protein [Patulibacter americanus]|uniref:hypothetical protein n=1 Tax=Patulibacter americanus TaxID=588672 RepID=UPI0003B5BFFB|nr:hypothetical protein [Patulibacter americanus]